MSALQVNVIDMDGINAKVFVGDLPGFYVDPDWEATLYSPASAKEMDMTPELYDVLWAEIAEAQERGSADPRRAS